jgi:large subunit ribosomal protein L9
MKTMEVLLREHIDPLGKCGDVVTVKAGYARNYLLPNRLAIQANADNKKAMERRRLKLDAEEAERMAEIETRVLVLSGTSLETVQKCDDNGHLYGSVNAALVVELLNAQNRNVEEKDVRIDVPIKTIGEHTVHVHVHGERYADIEIDVQPEGGMPAGLVAKAEAEAAASAAEAEAEAEAPSEAPAAPEA